MRQLSMRTYLLGAVALALLVATPALAQLQTGNLYGTVKDNGGAALPGVTATLSGGGAPQVQVTNATGQFRFLGLAPGSYQLKTELEGFSPVDYPNIAINVGRNTTIEVTMTSAVEDVITVTAESPLLDERKISTGADLSKTELEKIPTARDPWVILQSAPGVLLDRVNVGGNQSGQQSTYTGPGSTSTNAIWSVDGVVITDMAALGASPTYYDFDAFEEMQVTTGGTDTTIATGGVVLNMVTKRGTNEWRGSGRYLNTRDAWQSSTGFDDNDLAKPGPWNQNQTQHSFKQGNRITDIKDYGAELGGPIVKDRLWIWGSYSRQKVGTLTVSDVSDFTDLEDYSSKLNAQISAANSATGFQFRGNKTKLGRGAGPTRPQETTWDQDGPTDIYKAEDTHVFSSSFYLTGLYSYAKNVFELVPEGGLGPNSYVDDGAVWHNTFFLYQTERPSHQYKADASSFFNTGALSHELKFGAGYRKMEVNSVTAWGAYGPLYNASFAGTSQNLLGVSRDAVSNFEMNYRNAYLQDTLSKGNLTANIGLRWDKQGGKILPETARANPLLPSVIPAVSLPGGGIGFDWSDITPRLGLTYALGAERKTLLRASYSRFADQLGGTLPVWLNPLLLNGYVYFYTTNPGTPVIPPSQIDLANPVFYSANVNPLTGGALLSNAVDPGLSAPTTDELLFGVEHALRPELVIGLNLTYRKLNDLLESDELVFDSADPFSAANLGSVGRRAQRSDFVPLTITGFTPDGKPYTTTYYDLRSGVTTRNGHILSNGDLEQTYKGASFVLNKRLANRWMARGNFTLSDWTFTRFDNVPDPTPVLGAGNREGDQVLQGSATGAGSRGGVYINSKWSYSVNGLYQIAPDRPWGFNVAANLTGRQGYPLPYFRRVTVNGGTAFDYVTVAPHTDTYRLPNLRVLDLRAEKELTFGDFTATVGVDVFNVTNEGTVLQRQHRLNRTTTNFATEIVSPRIFRLGVRFAFR